MLTSPVVIEGAPHILASARDITDRQEIEARLRRTQKMEAIGRLAGGIAHDFNNILTGILGATDLLLRALPPELEARRDAEEMVLMLRRLIGEDIELVIEAQTTDSWIQADPSQLQQVVLNLAVNARDAMPQGGRLTITVDHPRPGESPVGLPRTDCPAKGFVRMRVEDTGVGMDEATQSRIFEPFFTTKPMGKGTGMGLATVYTILERLGGWIEVKSAPASGTVFSLWFPRVVDPSALPAPAPGDGLSAAAVSPPLGAPAAAVSPAGAAGTPHRPHRVLVVEDEPSIRNLISRILTRAGHETVVAPDPDAALALMQTEDPFDLVVTDVVMPGMRGTDLVAALRAMHPDLSVIFISGYAAGSLDDPALGHSAGQPAREKTAVPLAPDESER